MTLVTIADIKDTAQRRGLVLLNYDDQSLQDLCDEAQTYIEEMTGRVFDVQSTDTNPELHFSISGDSIILNHAPLISLESLKIDGNELQSLNTLRLNKKSGIIYLSPNVPTALGYPLYQLYPGFSAWSSYPYDAEIEYTYGYNPTYPQAIRLAKDFVINRIRENRRDLKEEEWLPAFDKRLIKLKRPFIATV